MRKRILKYRAIIIIQVCLLGFLKAKAEKQMLLFDHVKVSEKEIVHSLWPKSLVSINDSILACLVDSRYLVQYNINTGEEINPIDIKQLIDSFDYNYEAYVNENYAQYYKDRIYETNKDSVAKRSIPSAAAEKIIKYEATTDTYWLSVYIATPYYKKPLIFDSETQIRHLSSSQCIVVLSKGIVKKIHPIKGNLFPNVSGVVPLDQSGIVINEQYISSVMPLAVKGLESTPTDVVINLETSKANIITSRVFENFVIQNRQKWYPRRVYVMEGNNCLTNSIFDIFSIDTLGNTKEILNLRKQLDTVNYEHILSFAPSKENDFIIQTIKYDSGFFYQYYFYKTSTKELIKFPMLTPAKTISPHVIYKDNKIIYFTRDEEHYYIDTYQISGS